MNRLMKLAVAVFACSVGLAQAGELTLFAGGVLFGNAYTSVTLPTDAVPAAGEFGTDHGHAFLSGDGATPATIRLASGSTFGAIDAPVTDLQFDTVDGCVSGSRESGVSLDKFLPADPANMSSGTEITYWKDRALADIRSVRATLVYGSGGSRTNIARTCFFARDLAAQTATAQFQSRISYDQPHIICVKVEFKQVGDDITARAVYSKWIKNGDVAVDEAYDFDKGGNSQNVYDCDISTGGYGVCGLLAGEIGNDNKGGKGLKIEGTCAPLNFEKFSTSNSETLRWENLRVEDVDGLYGKLKGNLGGISWLRKVNQDDSVTFVLEQYSDGGQISKDEPFQRKNYITYAKVRLTQNGADVDVFYEDAGYMYETTWNDTGIPFDPDAEGIVKNYPYELANLVPILKRGSGMAVNGMPDVAGPIAISHGGLTLGGAALTTLPAFSGDGTLRFFRDVSAIPDQGQYVFFGPLAANSTAYAGVTVFDGCRARIENGDALSKVASAPIIVENGAEVILHFQSGKISSSGGTIFIRNGSTVRVTNADVFDRHNIYLDRSTLSLESGHVGYIEQLTLMNGSKILSDNPDRAFRSSVWALNEKIVSDGEPGNEIQCGINMKTINNNPTFRALSFINFCVRSDLLISGNLKREIDTGYGAVRAQKCGAATLMLSGNNVHTANWEVVEGTLKLASETAVNAANGIRLMGGHLELTATNTCAFLAADEAANLAFADAGALLLSGKDALRVGGNGLTICGVANPENGIPLRIGETKALSRADLAKVRCEKGTRRLRVYQRDDGWLEAEDGLLLIFR